MSFSSLIIPEGNVTKITDASGRVLWNAFHKPTQWLTFSAPETFSISVSSPKWDGAMYYSTDTINWAKWNGEEISGTKICIAGIGNDRVGVVEDFDIAALEYITACVWTLTGSNITCIGNIETLLDYTIVEAGEHPVMARQAYYKLFSGCTGLIQAPELPAVELIDNCYYDMFKGCTNLTQAPKLPATTLAMYCYCGMFQDCTNLTIAPELPATTLAMYCYYGMFKGCTSLIQAPALPTTTLIGYCYFSMFEGCTSLTQAPELPATTLAERCYPRMFYGCASLATVPELSATTLTASCYSSMFANCTSLTQAPKLPATALADYCYNYMFSGCTNLTQAPELPATTLAIYCYNGMFQDCASLTQAPELPATTLANYCYASMFSDCTNLTTAPELPITTLANSCYNSMFMGCTSLTQVPELPATTLASECYKYMFIDCTGIKLSETQTNEYTQEYRIPISGTGTTATNALMGMFSRTGGTFTDTPGINTTYYLHKDCTIIPEPEFVWGDDGAEVDAEWFAGLKKYLQTNSGASLTTSDGSSIVGTTKSVTLTSEVLGTTTHLIRVIGVDQDANNTVTWQTKNCLSDITVFGSSSPAWIGSTARTLCQNYYDYFPGKASIKTVSKGTCANYNDSRAGTATYNNETVFLLSEREMGLDSYSPISTANSTTTNAECTYGKNFSYTYYSSNTNRVKKQGDSGSAYYYWERSRYYRSDDTDLVCGVGYTGSANDGYYGYGAGLAPAFVIGN